MTQMTHQLGSIFFGFFDVLDEHGTDDQTVSTLLPVVHSCFGDQFRQEQQTRRDERVIEIRDWKQMSDEPQEQNDVGFGQRLANLFRRRRKVVPVFLQQRFATLGSERSAVIFQFEQNTS